MFICSKPNPTPTGEQRGNRLQNIKINIYTLLGSFFLLHLALLEFWPEFLNSCFWGGEVILGFFLGVGYC